jgi:hypothetical protein
MSTGEVGVVLVAVQRGGLAVAVPEGVEVGGLGLVDADRTDKGTCRRAGV